MAWRKWLVRSLVFSALGALVLAGLLYEAWTNPGAVRRQVLDKLGQQFVGASVSLDSARLRLLGGIAVRDLRMARRDDLDRGDFLYVPSAIIYHDKEHMLDGTLGVRKIELDRPRLRVVRERDGRINLSGILSPPDLKERVPTVIIRRGTIVVEDRSLAGGAALLEIKDVNLTLQNDPLPTLTIEGTGQTDVVGAVRLHARFQRPTDALSALVELPVVPVEPALVERVAAVCPDAAAHLRQLHGTGKVELIVTHLPGAAEPWGYDARCQLSKGEWSHACLPAPLTQVEATLRCVNGRVPEVHLTGRAGAATVDVTLRGLAWPGRRPDCIEQVVQGLDARVEHLNVTPRLFDNLPPTCKELQQLYSPAGPVTLGYHFRRSGDGGWHKHWDVRPEGMTAEFEHFRYPIEGITGQVSVDFGSGQEDEVVVDLSGRGSGRPVTVKGTVRGEKAAEVDLVVSADNVPVDHKLMRALPERSRELARTFLPARSRELGQDAQPLGQVQPAGLADIKVYVRRQRGRHDFSNRYVVAVHDACLRYDLFPYPLENVSGVLDIRPGGWECRDFRGSHKGGEFTVNACSFRSGAVEAASARAGRGQSPADDEDDAPPEGAGPQRECVKVGISGRGILLDREFEQALSPEGSGRDALRNAWSMMALRGRLDFEAVVADRPDQPQDIDVTVGVSGCTMQPEFFRYPMTDVAARVRYAQGRVYLKEVSARHGACRLSMDNAVIVLKQPAGFQAWFYGIRGEQLRADEEFLAALHPAMRRGLEPLHPRKPVDVETFLCLDAPAVPGEPMKIWWEGQARLRDQVFEAGLEVAGVDGVIACEGYHNGRQFERVSGHALLERASILGQPFRNLHGYIVVDRDKPDELRLYNLHSELFGGTVDGEARFDFGPSLHYEVKLDALQVQLAQFGRHNRLGPDAQLQGPVRVSLHLTGDGTDLNGLRGNGLVKVDHGKLYRLPLLLDLLKAFGLRLPDRTAFEDAKVLFAIEGPQMRIHELNLYGSAISLRGLGTVNLDGSNVNLDFSADWGRVPQMLPAPVSDLSQALSDQLFKIKMRGKLSSPRFEKELMPGVVDPIKKVLSGP